MEVEEEEEKVYEISNIDDLLNELKFSIAEFNKQNNNDEIKKIFHIPSYLIENLMNFKYSLPESLDVFEEYIYDGTDMCKFSENYEGDKKFFLILGFEFFGENDEWLEIGSSVYFDSDEEDD